MDRKNTGPLALKPEEQKLFDEIEQTVQTIRKDYQNQYGGVKKAGYTKILSYDERVKMRRENAQKCFELHRLLKRRDRAPVHNKYMLQGMNTSTSGVF